MNAKDYTSVIRSFVHGDLAKEELERIGIIIKSTEDGYEFSNPEQLVATVGLRDVAQGLLRFRSNRDALRDWAGLVVAGSSFIEFEPEFENKPEGDILLSTLWDVWFRQEVPDSAFGIAERLLNEI
jgi:hypothetical protein